MPVPRPGVLEGLSLLQLKYVAYMLGLPTAGNKKLLVNSINALRRPLLPSKSKGVRVLSVDMGIRNLAYCVMDVAGPTASSQTQITLTTWKRKDLTQESSDDSEDPLVKAPVSDVALGSPRFLSKIAFATTRELLAHQPDIILIEQQRWRSSGAAGVQQWTIRVNSLENMIWACWRAIQQTRPDDSAQFPEAFQIDPKRVAAFFPQLKPSDLLLDRSLVDSATRDRASMKDGLEHLFQRAGAKVTKAHKVAVVRGWLEQSGDITLEFQGQAQTVARSFASRKPGTKRNTTTNAEPFGKLDDLADCLLQGVTWYRWQQNAQRLAQDVQVEEANR